MVPSRFDEFLGIERSVFALMAARNRTKRAMASAASRNRVVLCCRHEKACFPACAELWALGPTRRMGKVYGLPKQSGQTTAQGFLPVPQIQPFS
jgi:hypothetical protein